MISYIRQSAPLALVWLLLSPNVGPAGDWPQILGPDRTGLGRNESLAETWPEGGPKTLWQHAVGDGFSGVAVQGNRAIVFHHRESREIVEALDADTGKALWQQSFPVDYVPSFINDRGPRAYPLIRGDRVYVYGVKGNLHCLDLATGKPVWSRDTFGDYHTGRPQRGEPPEGYFGVGSTPLLEGNALLVNVGGDAKDAGIVAFDAATGKTLWTSTATRASYSSPVAATIDGRRHVIFVTRFSVVSLDPSNGDVRFEFPFGRPGPSVSAANPVLLKDHLFVSASYGFGAVFARVKASDAEILWTDDESLSSQYTTSVADGRHLYGIHGRQDVGAAELRCLDPFARKVRWAVPNFGYATLIQADEKLIILKSTGELVLARVNPERFEELATAKVLNGVTRALPALSNGRLYVRDTNTLKCLDLGE